MDTVPILTLLVGSPTKRGYLDEVDRMTLLHKISQRFDSFTMQDAVGYRGGKREQSIMVRIASTDITAILDTAAAVRVALGQEEVGIECGGFYYRAAAGTSPKELAATIRSHIAV